MTNRSITPVFTRFQREVESAKNADKMLALEQSIYDIALYNLEME